MIRIHLLVEAKQPGMVEEVKRRVYPKERKAHNFERARRIAGMDIHRFNRWKKEEEGN